MSEYFATVSWERGEQVFAGGKYSRGHRWAFDGGVVVPASASPHVVPPPWSVAANVDPEEAFVAALSSCHMLFFLDLAYRRGFVVDSYVDEAIGIVAKNAEGRTAMTRVTLRPAVRWSGDKRPAPADIDSLHHKSHDLCFIANSVKTEVVIAPR